MCVCDGRVAVMVGRCCWVRACVNEVYLEVTGYGDGCVVLWVCVFGVWVVGV